MKKKQLNNLYSGKSIPKQGLWTCGGIPEEYHIIKTVTQDQESEIKTHYDCYEKGVSTKRFQKANEKTPLEKAKEQREEGITSDMV